MGDLDEKARRAAEEWVKEQLFRPHFPELAASLAAAFKAFALAAQRCDCGRDLCRGLCLVCDNDE